MGKQRVVGRRKKTHRRKKERLGGRKKRYAGCSRKRGEWDYKQLFPVET